jgi:peptidoglycan/LPS O-acetylase OafA/YrhL
LAAVALALGLLLSLTFNRTHAFGHPSAVWREIVAVLTGFYNYLAPLPGTGDRFTPFWSLSLEEQFYVALPFLFILLPTAGGRMMAALFIVAAVGLVGRNLNITDLGDPIRQSWYMKFSSHRKFDAPMVGVLLALFRARGWGSKLTAAPRWARALIAPAIITYLTVATGANGIPLVAHTTAHPTIETSVALASALLIFLSSLQQGYMLEWPLLGRALEIIGQRAYPIYLFHMTAFRLYDECRSRLGIAPLGRGHVAQEILEYGLRLALVLVIAEIMHRLIEVPLMRSGRKAPEALDVPIQSGFEASSVEFPFPARHHHGRHPVTD